MKNFFLFIFLFIAGITAAQKITLCRAYTHKGEPIDLIYASGLILNQSVCVLFSGENKKIAGKTVHLYIDKITGTVRENLFSKSFKPAKENWIVHVYKFLTEGRYEIYFTDERQNRYAALSATIGLVKPKKEIAPPVRVIYPDAELIFCESVQYGRPINIKSSVSLAKDMGMVNFYLNANRPLNTGKILLNIWRRSKPGLAYDELYAVKKYLVEPDWNDTFVRFKFTKTGDYKVTFYDEKELLIKTAYISVTN